MKNTSQAGQTNDFLTGPILPPLIRFSLPLMLSLLLQAFYGGVDLAVVGRYSPTASVSAVATGSQLMQSVTSLITGLTMGVTVLVGKAIGAGDPQQAGRTVAGQIRLFAAVSAILTGFMLLFAPQIAALLNVPDAAMPEAVRYIRIPLSYALSRIPNTGMLLISLAIPASSLCNLLLCVAYFIWLRRKDRTARISCRTE